MNNDSGDICGCITNLVRLVDYCCLGSITALKPLCNPLVCTGLIKGAEFSFTPFHRSSDLYLNDSRYLE